MLTRHHHIAALAATFLALACSPAVDAPQAPRSSAPARAALPVPSPQELSAIRAEEPARAAAAKARLEALRPGLGLDARSSFDLVAVRTDAFGQTHARFAQRYAGLPVFGAQAVMHTGLDGAALPPTLQLATPAKVATEPSLGAADAIDAADRALARKGAWSVPPKAELVLWPVWTKVPVHPLTPGVTPNALDFKRVLSELVLAWHVHTELENAQDGTRHTDFVVDARTGRTVHTWDSLQTGTGHSQYSGTVAVGTGQGTSAFYLQHSTIPHATFNLGTGTSGAGTICSDADDVWGDGTQFDGVAPFDDANGQTAAVDATYGAEQTWTFFEQVLGRNGIDDLGSFTFSRVHYSTGYDNAFWSNSCFCMTYGDGSGRAGGGFDTLTSLDIIAHEFTHGVTATSAALIYDGESGGLNESTSDIFGAMVEFYARGGGGAVIGSEGGNWELAEQIADWPLRYMDRPSDDGYSPDAWFPGIEHIDVHYSSGPMNRAFYFLSQGASVNAADRSFSEYLPAGMEGVGNDAAAAIWYRALTAYLTPTSDYVAARMSALRAAADLYGRLSPEFAAVRKAFAGINVGYDDGEGDDLTPPAVALAVAGGPGAFTFTAVPTDDGAMERVDFFVDGAAVGADSSSPYHAGFDALLGHGTHDAFAVAYDAAGNYGVSEPVTLEVADPDQLLQNPGFEEDPGLGWSGDPIVFRGYPDYAHRGTGFAYVGGYGYAASDTIEQAVTIPAGATAQLAFRVHVETAETPDGAYDGFTATILDEAGATLETAVTLTNLDAIGGYALHVVDLTAYAGQTIAVRFQSVEDDWVPTAFWLDEVTVRASAGGADVTAPVAACRVSRTWGTMLAFTVDARDDRAVASAELFVDGASLGTVTDTFAAGLDSTSMTNGAHTFSATVADAAGNTGTCEAGFHVDNTAAQLVANPSFELAGASATQAAGWTSSNTRRYANLGNRTGSYALVLNGYNLASYPNPVLVNYSQQVVTIPAGAESVMLRYYLTTYSSYSDGLPHDTVKIEVRDETGATVLGTPVLWRDNDWPGGYEGQADLSAYAGQTVTLRLEGNQAKDPAGNWSYFTLDDVELHVSSAPDLADPAVALKVYGNAGILGFEASATDNVGVEKIDVWVDDTLIGTSDPLFPSSVFLLASVPAGAHEATAVATDLSGRTGEATVAFDAIATPADQAIPVVAASASTTAEVVTLTASATDDLGVAVVEFYVDGVFQGRDTVPPYGLALDAAPFGTATHTLIARAFDAAQKEGASAPVLFAVGNDAPVVSAGADATVSEGGSFTLQGSATDADGDTLTYAWTQTGGAAVTLSSASEAQPSFTAPLVTADTALTFRLTVTDGRGGAASDEVTVTVTDVNHPPAANAGADQTVEELSAVTLSGSATDADGHALTYAWAQASGPQVALSGAAAATATFTAPAVSGTTSLRFTLTVTDDHGGTSTDSVTVTVTDVPAKKSGGGGCSTGGDPSGVLLPLLGLAAAVLRRRRVR